MIRFITSPEFQIDCGFVDMINSRIGYYRVRVLRSPDVKMLGHCMEISCEKAKPMTPDKFHEGDCVVRSTMPIHTLNRALPHLIKGRVVGTDDTGSIQYLNVVITEADDPQYVGRHVQGMAWWCYELEDKHLPECTTHAPIWSMFEG